MAVFGSAYRHRGRLSAGAVLAGCLLLFVGTARGQIFSSARLLGTAGGLAASAKGIDAAMASPALLAFNDTGRLDIRLFGVGVDISNNAFTTGDYNRYNGATLSDADKADILDLVPDSGLRARGRAEASVLSVRYKNVAFVMSSVGFAASRFDKDYFDLLLNGNRVGYTYSIDDTDGEAMITSSYALSAGYAVYRTDDYDVAVGGALKYVAGHGYVEINRSEGGLTVYDYYFDAELEIAERRSSGAGGILLDLGAAARFRGGKLRASLSLLDFGPKLKWKRDNEENIFVFTADSLVVFEDRDELEAAGVDTTIEDVEFSKRYPNSVVLSVTNAFSDRFILGATLIKRSRSNPAHSGRSYFGLGGEYYAASWIPVRMGFGTGSGVGFISTYSTGLDFTNFTIDFTYVNHGLFFFSSKGIGLGVTADLHF